MIIGICGLIGSGKDTIADYLVRQHGYKKLSFADALKDSTAALLDWDREMLEGNSRESRNWRELPDEILSKELGREISPRSFLQEYGTDIMRQHFHNDIWVILAKKKMLENPETNYVISDVRFNNEKKVIKDLGGDLWVIKRGEQPSWWFDAIKTNNGSINFMRGYDVHESEYKWVDFDSTFDAVIKNDKTIEELHEQVEKSINT